MSSSGLILTDAIQINTRENNVLTFISPNGCLMYTVILGSAIEEPGNTNVEAQLLVNNCGKFNIIKTITLTEGDEFTRVTGGGANPCFNLFSLITQNPTTLLTRVQLYDLDGNIVAERTFENTGSETIQGIRGGEFSEDGNFLIVTFPLVPLEEGGPARTRIVVSSAYDLRTVAQTVIEGSVYEAPRMFSLECKFDCRKIYKVKNCNDCYKDVNCDDYVRYNENKFLDECAPKRKYKKYKIRKQYVAVLVSQSFNTEAFINGNVVIAQPIFTDPITDPATNPIVGQSVLEIYEVNYFNGTLTLVDGVRLPQVATSIDLKRCGDKEFILIGTGRADTAFTTNIYVPDPINGITNLGPYPSLLTTDGAELRQYEFDGCQLILNSKREVPGGAIAEYVPCSEFIAIGQLNYQNGTQNQGNLEFVHLCDPSNINSIDYSSYSVTIPQRPDIAVSANGWVFVTGAGEEPNPTTGVANFELLKFDLKCALKKYECKNECFSCRKIKSKCECKKRNYH